MMPTVPPSPCPRDPPCPHPLLVHDSGYLDLVDVCLQGCPCGRADERVVVEALREARTLLGEAA